MCESTVYLDGLELLSILVKALMVATPTTERSNRIMECLKKVLAFAKDL